MINEYSNGEVCEDINETLSKCQKEYIISEGDPLNLKFNNCDSVKERLI